MDILTEAEIDMLLESVQSDLEFVDVEIVIKAHTNVLALDIDDCILPSEGTYFGRVHDTLEILELNLKRIKMMLDKYNMKVFITSSWYIHLTLDTDGNITYKNPYRLSIRVITS